jgi:O-antigen/teichoic acid export membrane protein
MSAGILAPTQMRRGGLAGGTVDGMAASSTAAESRPTQPEEDAYRGRFNLKGRALRVHAARGSIINAAWVVGLYSLGFLRGFIVARFLTAGEYGIWGILVVSMGTLWWLKQIGIGDKYIQQSDDDQELAFQKAFTLEVLFSSAFTVLLLAALPLLVLIYGRSELLLPGLVVATMPLAGALTTPTWVYYRRMDFVRQRLLQIADPIVGFVVTIGLAVAGAGYWSLVIGLVAGAWTSALVSVLFTPYKLKFRFERKTLREYSSFSWPLFVSGACGIVIAQGSMLVGETFEGLAAAGALALAASIVTYADRVDDVITTTLYPAICAVKDRTELLFETFVKSNRLALIWSVPFGLGLTLFAPDLVHSVLGDKWATAIPLLQVFGLNTVLYQIGFNWQAFFKARGETRPSAVVSVITMVAFLVSVIPLTIEFGLGGLAAGMAFQTVVNFAVRTYFLTRLFDGFRMARHVGRALAPAVPAAAVVLLARLLETGDRHGAQALGELALYLCAIVAATYVFERALLKELWSYLRPAASAPAQPEAAS